MFNYCVRFLLKSQNIPNSSKIMNTRSKLNLKALKTANKESPKAETTQENGETASKYFAADVSEPRKLRGIAKKRRSIEVKYEDVEKVKKSVTFEDNSRMCSKSSADRDEKSLRNVEKPQKLDPQPSTSVKPEKPTKKTLQASEKSLQTSENATKTRARSPQNQIKIKEEQTEEKSSENDKNESTENQENILVAKWTPENWEKTYELIKEMRKGQTAPVDDMGCHKCSDKDAAPPIFRFQSLLALMLSSQTKDQVTHAAMERLKLYGCTPMILLASPDEVLEKLIHPVSFYKRKVQYIKETCKILLHDYNGDIPDTIEGLCALPGVGPKMGHICMQVAWNKVTGIGVDTHVHRICNRLQWVKKQAKTPEDTRKQLEDWLPQQYWTEINYLLVGFGQEICLPQHPKCGECLNRNLCPFAKGKK